MFFYVSSMVELALKTVYLLSAILLLLMLVVVLLIASPFILLWPKSDSDMSWRQIVWARYKRLGGLFNWVIHIFNAATM